MGQPGNEYAGRMCRVSDGREHDRVLVAPSPAHSCSPRSPAAPTPSTPLTSTNVSVAQDGTYFTDVTEADPKLVTYEQKEGNIALRALLTDGSAFCALLERGGRC